MKPFNLEAAKRGESIQTRDGRKAHFIGVAPDDVADGQPVVVWIAGRSNPDYYSENGSYYRSGGGSALDLFMAPTMQERWLVVYRPRAAEIRALMCDSEAHSSQTADNLRSQGYTVLTHGQRIEWEE